MRALLAARAIAVALVVVPLQARPESLPFAVESDSDVSAPSHVMEAQSRLGAQEALLGTSESALSAWFSADGGNDANAGASGAGGASADTICTALDRSASQNDLPLDFFTRLIWQESRFNPLSVSHAGTQGIAQFMPGTARRVGLGNPFDPIEALPKSAELLRELGAQFGNLGLAAAAYNAGPKRVEDWLAKRKVLPLETEAYVRIITGRSAQEWTSADAGTWNLAVAAPGPCEQLAKPSPRRAQPVVASRQPERPAHPIVVAQKLDRPAPTAHQESIRCCHLPANGIKPAHPAAGVAARESIRCCHSPANGVKVAHLESSADSKSTAGVQKGAHARAHLIGSSSARGSTAEASRASSSRERPAVLHRRPAPSARTARLA
jgi:hypothetical protein